MARTRGHQPAGDHVRCASSPPSRAVRIREDVSVTSAATGAVIARNQDVALPAREPIPIKVNHNIALRPEDIEDIKAGRNLNLITIYVPNEDPGPGRIVSKDIAYLVCQRTFDVYEANGERYAENKGNVREIFPRIARELEMAIRFRDGNMPEDNLSHIYHPNHPGPKNAEWKLLDPESRFTVAELNKPSNEALTIWFINLKDGKHYPELFRHFLGLDFSNPDHIRRINKWRAQILTRRGCDMVRFDKALDDMWTVLEHDELARLIKQIITYHMRRKMRPTNVLELIKWDLIKKELEKHCRKKQPKGSPLSILADSDKPGEGFHQRRTLVSDRLAFSHSEENIQQRAWDTLEYIMKDDVEINEQMLKQSEKYPFFELSPEDPEPLFPELEAAIGAKKVAALDNVATGRVEKSKNRRVGAAPHCPRKSAGAKILAAAKAQSLQKSEDAHEPPFSPKRITLKLRVSKASSLTPVKQDKGKQKEIVSEASPETVDLTQGNEMELDEEFDEEAEVDAIASRLMQTDYGEAGPGPQTARTRARDLIAQRRQMIAEFEELAEQDDDE